MKRMVHSLFLPMILLAVMTQRAFSQTTGNIVQNGGFETGDFTGWVASGALTDTLVSLAFPHSGAFGAVFGAADTPDYISQTLPTSAGHNYVLSFWVSSGDTGGGTPNEFIVQWGGTTLLERLNMVIPAWTNIQFLVTAPSDNTVLAFGGFDNPDYILLDDISVAAPAPAFETVTQTNGSVEFTWSSLPGQVYQLQYTSNLSPPGWSSFGEPITATNTTMSAVDAMSSEPRRYYRILLK
jgi:hypothetical protein